jgi:hypothetical protein
VTWSAHVNQVRKRTVQRLGVLGPLRNRTRGLSVRNGVLLYKQLIRPVMDYACPIWRFAARSHVQKLQVLQAKCIRIAINAPWYVGNRQIHEDLGISYFADHIRALTENLDWKLAGAGNPLVWQLGRHLRRPRADWSPPGNGGEMMCSRPAEAVTQKTAKSEQRVVLWLLGYPDSGLRLTLPLVSLLVGSFVGWLAVSPWVAVQGDPISVSNLR